MNIAKRFFVTALASLCLAQDAGAADESPTTTRSSSEFEKTELAQMTQRYSPMLEALHAERPNEALASKLHLYGQFVGSWRVDIDYHAVNGTVRRAEGEWHFGWVLDGKAIQDVWIFPARKLRGDGKPAEPWYFYGSTFRWYDPTIDAWHITYFEPTRPFEVRQLGRAAGPDIVQIGEDYNGVMRRWRFVEITGESFRWLGEVSWDKGATWTLEMDMRAKRIR